MEDREVSDESPSESIFDEHAYKLLAAAVFVLVATATVVYRSVEDWSWVDSFYFSTVAVTTVGFGDLAPSTDGSKLFTIFYIAAGVALIGTYFDVALRRRATRIVGHRR